MASEPAKALDRSWTEGLPPLPERETPQGHPVPPPARGRRE
ncbi:hypothetical protein [Streptomyces sp. NPDC004783]